MIPIVGARAARALALAAWIAVAILAPPAGPARAGIRVHGPDEVAARWILAGAEGPVIAYGDRRWSLVADASDPAVSTLGDGGFHPMSVSEVEAALRGLGRTAERVQGTLLVLPLPRRETLRSSCEEGVIYLSPGIREVHPAHVHSTVAHEVGHLLQDRAAREGSAVWSEYLALRGLTDAARFSAASAHRDRPREVFAEDFRVLFGGALAQGPHENGDLADPRDVPGLRAWFERTLAGEDAPEPAAEPQSFPNPFSAGLDGLLEIRFRAAGGTAGPATAEVFDLAGRRVQTLRASDAGTGAERTFLWDGRDAGGARAGSGFYFVRWREHPAAGTARVQILR
jgi:hypothetical protein